jgi:hypothetical protein
MSEQEKEMPVRSKFWIWFLVFILVILLMVPIVSISLAVYKGGWVPLIPPRRVDADKPTGPNVPASASVSPAQAESLASLRERMEKFAASVLKTPKLSPNMQQVQIQTHLPSMEKAADAVREVLQSKNHQFVVAESPDSIRIVVILPSAEWAELSAGIQTAIEKNGFSYRGPTQTFSSETQADSMIAEIEILQKSALQSGRQSKATVTTAGPAEPTASPKASSSPKASPKQ